MRPSGCAQDQRLTFLTTRLWAGENSSLRLAAVRAALLRAASPSESLRARALDTSLPGGASAEAHTRLPLARLAAPCMHG